MRHLADLQEEFLKTYEKRLPEDMRSEFRRHFLFMLIATYREAQQPLVKQLTEYIATVNRPFIFTTENEK